MKKVRKMNDGARSSCLNSHVLGPYSALEKVPLLTLISNSYANRFMLQSCVGKDVVRAKDLYRKRYDKKLKN